MRVLVDRFIELLKWPVALYMLLSLPAYIQSLYYFKFTNLQYVALFGGFFLFFISRSMMDSSVKSNMEIVAHEMTHAFFALLTLHKVTGIRVEGDNSGGNMSFEGEGNWLIVIAPYFFPLFGFFYMIAFSVYTHFAPSNLILNGILGFLSAITWIPSALRFMKNKRICPKFPTSFALCFCRRPIYGQSVQCWLLIPEDGPV